MSTNKAWLYLCVYLNQREEDGLISAFIYANKLLNVNVHQKLQQ